MPKPTVVITYDENGWRGTFEVSGTEECKRTYLMSDLTQASLNRLTRVLNSMKPIVDWFDDRPTFYYFR